MKKENRIFDINFKTKKKSYKIKQFSFLWWGAMVLIPVILVELYAILYML